MDARKEIAMFARLTFMEFKLMMREFVVPLLVLVLPVGLLLGFGFQPGGRQADPNLGGQTTAAYIAAIGAGICVAVLGLNVLPATLAGYREKGVLRRMATTPVRPVVLLAAQLAVYAAAALFTVVVLVVAGNALFGTPYPRHVPGFLASVVLGLAALFAIGLLIAALAPSGKAGQTIGMVVFFPSLFLAGVYVPREMMPAVLRNIGDYSPLGAALKTMRDSWTGSRPNVAQLVVLAAYAVVAGLAAARFFKWE